MGKLRWLYVSNEKRGKGKGKRLVIVIRAKPQGFLSETRDPELRV